MGCHVEKPDLKLWVVLGSLTHSDSVLSGLGQLGETLPDGHPVQLCLTVPFSCQQLPCYSWINYWMIFWLLGLTKGRWAFGDWNLEYRVSVSGLGR